MKRTISVIFTLRSTIMRRVCIITLADAVLRAEVTEAAVLLHRARGALELAADLAVSWKENTRLCFVITLAILLNNERLWHRGRAISRVHIIHSEGHILMRDVKINAHILSAVVCVTKITPSRVVHKRLINPYGHIMDTVAALNTPSVILTC
jgi:hypothetical protein